VAMNVNDIICVGAEPFALVDYLAVQEPDPFLIEQIAKGLHEGAETARIAIPGGEIAQIPEMLGDDGLPGIAFDLAGAAIGSVKLSRIISGRDIAEGDIIVGLRSSGVHSNGLTLARRALFQHGGLKVDTFLGELGRTVGEELLEPTIIYVPQVNEILSTNIQVKALIHITSDGFLNLTRVESTIGFVIDYLPEPHPIFSVIQKLGGITDQEMFRVYNMGIGFCIVVPESDLDALLAILRKHKTEAYPIGRTVKKSEKVVSIPSKRLVGRGNRFFTA